MDKAGFGCFSRVVVAECNEEISRGDSTEDVSVESSMIPGLTPCRLFVVRLSREEVGVDCCCCGRIIAVGLGDMGGLCLDPPTTLSLFWKKGTIVPKKVVYK